MKVKSTQPMVGHEKWNFPVLLRKVEKDDGELYIGVLSFGEPGKYNVYSLTDKRSTWTELPLNLLTKLWRLTDETVEISND